MRAIARAHQERNLADFEKALFDYKTGSLLSLRVHFITDNLPALHCGVNRTLIRPNDPLTPRSALRYTPRTKPFTNYRALFRS